MLSVHEAGRPVLRLSGGWLYPLLTVKTAQDAAGEPLFGSDCLVSCEDPKIGQGAVFLYAALGIRRAHGELASRLALQKALAFDIEINAVVPLESVIGIVIVVSVIVLFYRYVILRPQPHELYLPLWKLYVSPFLGLLLGALMGATSISGSIIVIAFIMVLKLPGPQAVGTTSVVSTVSLLVAAVAHISRGNVEWHALVGLVPGVLLGAAVAAGNVNRVPRQVLRIALLLILACASVLVMVN